LYQYLPGGDIGNSGTIISSYEQLYMIPIRSKDTSITWLLKHQFDEMGKEREFPT
jgi:hypothetical protein